MKNLFCYINWHDYDKTRLVKLKDGKGYTQHYKCNGCGHKKEYSWNPNGVSYCPCCEKRDEECHCGVC
jgi:hypothetical protein